MFSHVMVALMTSLLKQFYDAILGALGTHLEIWMTKAAAFISRHRASLPSRHPSMGSLLAEQTADHWLAAASPAEADAWHQAGIENGGTTLETRPVSDQAPVVWRLKILLEIRCAHSTGWVSSAQS